MKKRRKSTFYNRIIPTGGTGHGTALNLPVRKKEKKQNNRILPWKIDKSMLEK